MSKIVKLVSQNVKKVRAISITPDGNMVVISGANGVGKSSLLDSILYAMGGGSTIPAKPVRKGQTKAKIEVDLGDLVVRRTFTAAGGTALTVTTAAGVPQKSPQEILDRMVGKLTFDPLAFMRMKPPEQEKLLKDLAGLDFTKLDQERAKVYEDRTAVNREVKSLEARLAVVGTVPDGTPDAEVSAGEIMEEQRKAAATNSANQIKRGELTNSAGALRNLAGSVNDWTKEIDRLKRNLAEAEAKLVQAMEDQKSASEEHAKLKAEVDALVDVDLSGFADRLKEVEQQNKFVRQKKSRADLRKQITEKKAEADELSTRTDEIDGEKRTAILEAKFPIDGLVVSEEGGVMFDSLPLDQASTSGQLKVSLAIGMALNPKLRIVLMREGSFLDADSRKYVADWAEKNDMQVWLEVVGDGGETAVVIEDGMVAGAAEEPEADKPSEPKVDDEPPLLI